MLVSPQVWSSNLSSVHLIFSSKHRGVSTETCLLSLCDTTPPNSALSASQQNKSAPQNVPTYCWGELDALPHHSWLLWQQELHRAGSYLGSHDLQQCFSESNQKCEYSPPIWHTSLAF